MTYEHVDIPADALPRASDPLLQHLVDTYASETNKTGAIWRAFDDGTLDWRPHAKSSTVAEVLRHQLLSERRFFFEFLGSAEPQAAEVLPAESTVHAFTSQLVALATPRLRWIAAQDRSAWLSPVRFFDV